MDINGFRNRVRLKQEELAEKIGLDKGSVGNLCSGTRRPSYEVIRKLLLLGARVDEVFDEETLEAVRKSSGGAAPMIPDGYDTPEFVDGVEKVIRMMQERGMVPKVPR